MRKGCRVVDAFFTCPSAKATVPPGTAKSPGIHPGREFLDLG